MTLSPEQYEVRSPGDEKEIIRRFIRPFDLSRPPLMRLGLARLDSRRHLVLLDLHHILSDGVSAGIFLRDFVALYAGTSLPGLTLTYKDYACWQNREKERDVLKRQETYWRREFEGEVPVLNLPCDAPRPPVQSFEGGTLHFELDRTVTDGLHALGRNEDATLFMVLLAVYTVFLSKLSGQEDIVVGSPVAGRRHEDLSEIIGLFVNTLPLRNYPTREKTFRAFLREVRERWFHAFENQDYPFEDLIDLLHVRRDASRNPLFDTMFTFQNRLPTFQIPGMTVMPYEFESGTSKCDLSLTAADLDGRLLLSMEYCTRLLKRESVERFVSYLEETASSVLREPDSRIGDLPFMPRAERERILYRFSRTQTLERSEETLVDLFERQVEREPDKPALCFEGSEWTYRQVNSRANRVAHFLTDRVKMAPEDRVALLLERSEWFVVGMLGILKAGGAYVPLDPAYPLPRIEHMLRDSGCRMVLIDRTAFGKIGHGPADVPFQEMEKIDSSEESNPRPSIAVGNLAYVIYTSGSTGSPKGVMVEHRSVVNLVQGIREILYARFDTEIRDLLSAPMSFDASVEQIFGSLCNGNTLHIARDEIGRDPHAFMEYLDRYSINLINITPSFFGALLESGFSARIPKGLQHIVIGSESLPKRLVESFYRHGKNGNVILINMYGPTECCVDATYLPIHAHSRWDGPVAPIGRPMPNIRVYILDQGLSPVPPGIPGEIFLGGAGLARGYTGNVALTAERFLPNPFEEGTRLYRTGDVGRWLPDGNIEFLGRNDDQVKIRGYRIELGEIESRLVQHEAVKEAVVLARAFQDGGTGLVAYVVGHAGLNAAALRTHLRTTLPEYMVPPYFVQVEGLPLTPSGKIDRSTLPEPSEAEMALGTQYVAPRNETELALTAVWSDVLRRERVSIRDNFFDLGGHSLLALRLMVRIQEKLKKNLPLATLFKAPTIEQMSTILRQRTEPLPWSPLVPIQPAGSRRPFFCIPGVCGNVFYFYPLSRALGPDQPFYGLQAVGLDGETEPHRRIEDMAAHYIEAVLDVQPEGPYLLGGHSLGAYVAFEMERQFRELGQKVVLLAIFDAFGLSLNPLPEDSCGDDARWLVEIGRFFGHFLGQEVAVSCDFLRTLRPDRQLGHLMERLQELGSPPSETGTDQIRGLLQVFKANHRIRYVLQGRSPSRMILFRSSHVYPDGTEGNGLSEVRRSPTWGWCRYAEGPVEIHDVPGDHVTMLAEPHVAVLAERLKACLDEVQAGSKGIGKKEDSSVSEG